VRTARPLARLAPALTVAALLAGCTTLPGSPVIPTPSIASDPTAIAVSGAAGRQPTVSVPVPYGVDRTTKRVITTGTGAAVTAKQRVTIQYVGINGADGKTFASSWTKRPISFLLTDTTAVKGLVGVLVGSHVGDRFVVAIPPTDGYGLDGRPAAGIGPTDTIVMVVDVLAARSVLTAATGAAVPSKPGLPTVTLDSAHHPRITLPAAGPPAGLVTQPLIMGSGDRVAKGAQVTVQYTGVVWPGGAVFDSSWNKPTPSTFTIGTGQVLSGWDGLVGQTVGSRVLLVIPPDSGFGAEGKPQWGIKGTDTLVFVVDILDTA